MVYTLTRWSKLTTWLIILSNFWIRWNHRVCNNIGLFCVGTPIILWRNLKLAKLCNGTRLKVKALNGNIVEATVLTRCAQEKTVIVLWILLLPNDLRFEFKQLQFFLKVKFATTINKSQGQTLKFGGIELRENYYSHGQFYVDCSRISSPNSLMPLTSTNRLMKNIIYKEVL